MQTERRLTGSDVFLWPFVHSESVAIHAVAVDLYTAVADEEKLEFELKDRAIAVCFGRYPHRNARLGRVSTDEEMAFLSEPGSGF